MNILVTGGAGFIGSHIVEALVDDPTIKRVRIMDNLSTGFLDNIKPFIENGKVAVSSVLLSNLITNLQSDRVNFEKKGI